jgi:GNAT superfamily N-acetyltransferase
MLERRVDHPDAAQLLHAFYSEQVGRYGFAESVDLEPRAYMPPNGTFFVVYEDNRPVGCGGCRWFEPSTRIAEIKKTFLLPTVRRRGVGRALLARLEAEAARWGASQVILETGILNTAALGLFVEAGYEPMARYVAGRDPAINRAFGKLLDPTNAAQRASVR